MIVASLTLLSRRHDQSHHWHLTPSRSSMRLIHISHKVGCCLGNLMCSLQSTVVTVVVGVLIRLDIAMVNFLLGGSTSRLVRLQGKAEMATAKLSSLSE
jgi:hypothetical protein